MYSQPTQHGFTLIEVLVSLALFMVVMTMGVGAFTSILDANRKAQALQTGINNAYFSFETITRLIRTGTTYDCGHVGGAPSLTDCSGGNQIQFYDDSGRTINFRLNNGAIEEAIKDKGAISYGNWFALTAPEFLVQNFVLHVSGTAQFNASNDTIQPTVTIVITGVVNQNQKTQTPINLETTVTQRTIDL